MHTDEDYKDSINEESDDYSDFYKNSEEEKVEVKNNHPINKNVKIIIIIVVLALILIGLIFLLIKILKKEEPIDFNLTVANDIGNSWSKENVTINVDIPDDKNLKAVKYTINCTNKCEYVDVFDKKILISNNGVSNVTVVVINNDNVENKKNITVKIDNNSPQLTLSPNDTNISSKTAVTVCAVCTDNESGCKEEKVCKDYSKTSKNETLTVSDNAGNQTVSSNFNVTIGGSTTTVATPAPTCSLSVNKDGVVTASYKNANSYYGFSSNYSGKNENTKQLNSSEKRTGTTIKYYVKNKDGKTSSCSIKISCSCEYRSDDLTCYREVAKTINDPSSKECKEASSHTTYHTATSCLLLKDEGTTCKKQ